MVTAQCSGGMLPTGETRAGLSQMPVFLGVGLSLYISILLGRCQILRTYELLDKLLLFQSGFLIFVCL